MAIRTTCDGCFTDYNVPDDRAGKAFKCKECGATVRVPRPGERSAPPTAPAPKSQNRPRQRSKRKQKSSGGSGAVWIIVGVVAVVGLLGAIGGAAFLLWPKGGSGNEIAAEAVADGNGTQDSGNTAATTDAPALTVDEEKILAEYRQFVQTQRGASTEARYAAMQKFAADRNLTVDEVIAISRKDRDAREAARRVDHKWQPLQIAAPRQDWPTEAAITVPVGYGGARFSVPKVQSPFLLSSASPEGDTERRVFDLRSSEQIGQWTSPVVVGLHEQLSPDGRLVCQTDDLTLNITDATSGEQVRQIVSPDIHHVAYLTFISSKQIMIITPMTAEQTTDKTRRCLVFDATTGDEVSRFEHAWDFAGSDQIAVSPDGRYVVATGKGKSIEVVEISSGTQVCALDFANEGLDHGHLHCVAFSPDGKQIGVLEQRPLVALRLHLVDCSSGEVTRKIDLYGGNTSLGAPLEMQLAEPLVWFPDSRNVFIGKILIVDTHTGRRVWQARGKQSGLAAGRFPIENGLLYQLTTEEMSRLVTLPIDFERIAATQQSWPADALLSPGMQVGVSVDLSAGGLEAVNDVVAAGLAAKLERVGFTVGDAAEPTLFVSVQEGSVAFAWKSGDDVLWETVADTDTAMISQLGHLTEKSPEQAPTSEGVVRVQRFPVPYFISADGAWTLPVIEQINHEG